MSPGAVMRPCSFATGYDVQLKGSLLIRGLPPRVKSALTEGEVHGKRARNLPAISNQSDQGDSPLDKAKLGTKRTCPETGKNFYDLNKDPIVSPYTGEEYPLSFFETAPVKPKKAARKVEEEEKEDVEDEELEDDKASVEEEDDLEEDDTAAKELGDDEDEVVLETTDEDEDDGTTASKVPAGFSEDGVDDDDDTDLDDDEEDFDLGDDDIDIDDDIEADADEESDK